MIKILAAVSLLLALVLITLWIRSYQRGPKSIIDGESLERVEPNWRIRITSARGWLCIGRWDGTFTAQVSPWTYGAAPAEAFRKWKHWRESANYLPFAGGNRWWNERGFSVGDLDVKPMPGAISIHDWVTPMWSGRLRWLTVPYWFLTILFSVLPAFLIMRTLHRRRKRIPGHCRTCGYDIRATPNRCPECGTAAAA